MEDKINKRYKNLVKLIEKKDSYWLNNEKGKKPDEPKLTNVSNKFFDDILKIRKNAEVIKSIFNNDIVNGRFSSFKVMILLVDKELICFDQVQCYFQKMMDIFLEKIMSNFNSIAPHLYILESIFSTISDYPKDEFLESTDKIINYLESEKDKSSARTSLIMAIQYLGENHSLKAKKIVGKCLKIEGEEIYEECTLLLENW